MIVAVPAWTLAAGLVEQDVSTAQAALIPHEHGVTSDMPEFLAAAAPSVSSSIVAPWAVIYAHCYTWFIGLAIALVSYTLLLLHAQRSVPIAATI